MPYLNPDGENDIDHFVNIKVNSYVLVNISPATEYWVNQGSNVLLVGLFPCNKPS